MIAKDSYIFNVDFADIIHFSFMGHNLVTVHIEYKPIPFSHHDDIPRGRAQISINRSEAILKPLQTRRSCYARASPDRG